MNFADFTLAALNINDAVTTLRPLAFFVVGVAIYSIFIFNFYRFLGRKDIFELDLEYLERLKGRSFRTFFAIISYVAKYLIFFPIVAFTWFGVLSLLLAFLAKGQPVESIFLVAMAVLSAVRVAAYYNEDLSKDLAKILPFALLGIFLIDLSYFSISATIVSLQSAVSAWENIVYYLGFVIFLEFSLRVVSAFFQSVFAGGKSRASTAMVRQVVESSHPSEFSQPTNEMVSVTHQVDTDLETVHPEPVRDAG